MEYLAQHEIDGISSVPKVKGWLLPWASFIFYESLEVETEAW